MLSKIFIYVQFSSSLTALFFLFYIPAEHLLIRKTDIELRYHILRSILLIQPVCIGVYIAVRLVQTFNTPDIYSNIIIRDAGYVSSEWLPATPEHVDIPVILNHSGSLSDSFFPFVIRYTAVIWGVIAAASLVRKAFLYIRFRKYLKENTEYIRREGRVKILAVKQNIIPFLTGVIVPVIVVPQNGMDAAGLNMVIKHEMAHYRNKDHLLRIYTDILMSINWFNPVMRKITDNVNKESEILADAAAIVSTAEEGRLEYGNLLIHFAELSSEKHPLSIGLSSQADSLRERLEYISMKKRKRTSIAVIISAVTVISIFACGCARASKSAIDTIAAVSASGKGEIAEEPLQNTSDSTLNAADASSREETAAEPLQNTSDSTLNAADASEGESIKPESHIVYEDEHTLVYDGPPTQYDEEYADKWRGEHLIGPRTFADEAQLIPEFSIVDEKLQEIMKALNESKSGEYWRTAENGENLYSICNGVVIRAIFDGRWGQSIVIEDESGNKWRYAYLDKLLVKRGDHVNYGDLIGLAGCTGRTTEDRLYIRREE